MRTLGILSVLALFGCRSDGELVVFDGDVHIDLKQPLYGSFHGNGSARVQGVVTPSNASVFIEGVEVAVGSDGRFMADVELDHAYRNIDVEGVLGYGYERVRVPVFDGHDPLDTWPGGVTARVTPDGLTHLGEGLGGLVDELGWDEMLLAALPAVETDWLVLTPTEVTHSPSAVVLSPAEGGIDTGISLRDVHIVMDLEVPILGWTTPVSVGYGEILLTALAIPAVDDKGMVSLRLTDANLDLSDPEVWFGDIDGWVVELLLEAVSWVLEPISDTLLTWALDLFGEVEVGGPFAFDTDLMGMPLEARLSDLYGDLAGLGAGLGVGLGEPAIVGPLPIEAPDATEWSEGSHVAIGLHEGLLDGLLSDSVVAMLDQEISLGGTFGALIGNAITQLPGGDDAPEEDGWCLALEPGEARVVRLQTGVEPLAVLYLPDLHVDIGYLKGSSCRDWLSTSLAVELGIEVKNGTKIGVDMVIAEGAVLAYETTDEWEEDEVVEGVADFLDGAMGLLGGTFELDLADLFGGFSGEDAPFGGLGDLEPRIVDSQPLLAEDGTWHEGLYAVSLELWATE